jgi:hypothetical protein
MQPKQIEAIKTTNNTKIERGDFVILAKILGIKRNTALTRYSRNNEKAVLCMQDIISDKEKIVQKLKKKYAPNLCNAQ